MISAVTGPQWYAMNSYYKSEYCPGFPNGRINSVCEGKNNEGANGRFKCVAARGCCVKSEYFGGDVKVSSVVAGAL